MMCGTWMKRGQYEVSTVRITSCGRWARRSWCAWLSASVQVRMLGGALEEVHS